MVTLQIVSEGMPNPQLSHLTEHLTPGGKSPRRKGIATSHQNSDKGGSQNSAGKGNLPFGVATMRKREVMTRIILKNTRP